MRTATFTNFSKEEFIGYWDGKAKKFAPGKSVPMPDYLAAHFAKHLTNRELLRRDDKGLLIHKNGEKFVSPKKQKDVPMFMKFFDQAFHIDEDEIMGEEGDDVDTLIGVAEQSVEEKKNNTQDPSQPQVIVPPDFEEDDSEESFGGTPVELGEGAEVGWKKGGDEVSVASDGVDIKTAPYHVLQDIAKERGLRFNGVPAVELRAQLGVKE